jgi:hypothetical protein
VEKEKGVNPQQRTRPCMLAPVIAGQASDRPNLCDVVRWTDHLPEVLSLRLRQLDEIHRWLAGYFQVVAIMLQIPGAADYRCVEYESDEHLHHLIWNPDTRSTLNVLAGALDRLGVSHLLPQVPGGADSAASALPLKAQLCLAERDRNGLLSVVADCLDRLLVAPNIPGLLEDMGLESAESAPGGGSKGARAARKKRTRAVATPT